MSHVDDGTLHAYLDGALTGVEQAQVAQHLAGCPACRGRLAEARALIARAQDLLGRALPAHTPPLRRQAGGAGAAARRLPRWAPYAWAASLLLALSGGWWAARRSAVAPELAPPPSSEGLAVDQPGAAEPPARSATGAADAAGPQRPAGEARAADGLAARADQPATPPAEPKVTAAEPVPSAAMVATPTAQAETALERDARQSQAPAPVPGVIVAGAAAMAWAPVSLDSARALLGTAPLAVRDVPVGRIRASPGTDGTVLVEQPLSTTITIRLYQRRTALDEGAARGRSRLRAEAPAAAAVADSAPAGQDRLARYVDGVRVEILGALPVDSLNRLLERLRPIH